MMMNGFKYYFLGIKIKKTYTHKMAAYWQLNNSVKEKSSLGIGLLDCAQEH